MISGAEYVAAAENDAASAEYKRAAELSSLAGDVSATVTNNSNASMASTKAVTRRSLSPSRHVAALYPSAVMYPSIVSPVAHTAAASHRAHAISKDQASTRASIEGYSYLAAAEADSAAAEYKVYAVRSSPFLAARYARTFCEGHALATGFACGAGRLAYYICVLSAPQIEHSPTLLSFLPCFHATLSSFFTACC
jgi:hypothetical protein